MKKYRKNVRRRKDNRYEGRFIVGYKELYGEAIYKSVYAKTYKEVIEKLESAEALVAEEVALERCLRKRQKVTTQRGLLYNILSKKEAEKPEWGHERLEDWLLAWLEIYKKHDIKVSSYTRYSTIVYKHILPVLGKYTLCEITTDVLQHYLLKKMEETVKEEHKPLSAATLKGHITILSGAFEQAIKEKLMVENPCKNITLPQNKVAKNQILGKEEYKKLEQAMYQSFSNKKSVAILLALKTGIRLGELSALRWSDIDFEERIIQIRNGVQRVKNFTHQTAKTEMVFDGTKSFCSSRNIPMNDEIEGILRRYFKNLTEHGSPAKEAFAFSNKKNSFIDPRVYQYYFSKMLKQTGIKKINFHALRHTFATVAASKNMQISVLSRILGHSNISTTLKLYVHPMAEQDRIEMNKISTDYLSQSA